MLDVELQLTGLSSISIQLFATSVDSVLSVAAYFQQKVEQQAFASRQLDRVMLRQGALTLPLKPIW
jgi:hypothetical protein